MPRNNQPKRSKMVFNVKTPTNRPLFECSLKTEQCASRRTKSGERCRLRVTIGEPYCHHHLKKEKKLTIRDSRHGKGLFCWDPDEEGSVFRRGDIIARISGEIIDMEEFEKRYNRDGMPEITAPYAVENDHAREPHVIDGGCQRHFTQLANMADDGELNNAQFLRHPTNRNRINLVATRSIYHNQEILASYGNTYDLNTIHFTKRRSVALGPSEHARYTYYA